MVGGSNLFIQNLYNYTSLCISLCVKIENKYVKAKKNKFSIPCMINSNNTIKTINEYVSVYKK